MTNFRVLVNKNVGKKLVILNNIRTKKDNKNDKHWGSEFKIVSI
jgi:hypothetical protein